MMERCLNNTSPGANMWDTDCDALFVTRNKNGKKELKEGGITPAMKLKQAA